VLAGQAADGGPLPDMPCLFCLCNSADATSAISPAKSDTTLLWLHAGVSRNW
jgi:hypothetical protein